MTERVNGFKAVVTVIVAALTALWGWFGWLVVIWMGGMALDYLTGTLAALKNGKWSSQVAREGIWHKAGAISAVLAAALLDLAVGQLAAHAPNFSLPFAYTVFLSPLVVVWYILTEAGSVVENAGALGAPIPGWLKKVIAAFRDSMEDTAGKG